jgi:hypothetical protein
MALEKLRSRFNKNNLIILYKLLNDLLFVEIVFFLLALIGEGLLPGAVTAHVGFSKILVIVGITILAIFWVGNKANVVLSKTKINKKATYLLIFILMLLAFVSLIKISIFLNIFVSFLVILSGYYIYKTIIANRP